MREAKSWPSSSAERRRECVKSLLAGEQVDHSELGYDLDGHHLALMAKGEGAPEAMRQLAKQLDRRLLAVCREEESIWACWLGGRRPLDAQRALQALTEISLDGVIVTVGEPGEGLAGWRLSHRQAKAALPIAERRGDAVLHYADVVLLTSILRDDLVATSLHQLYLAPLEDSPDGGRVARRPCALTSPPSGTSPQPPSYWASIGARSRIAFVQSRSSSAVRSRTSRPSSRPPCASMADFPVC